MISNSIMKTLLILRHAKSSWNDPALNDHERPLNSRGRRDAPRMGQLLRQTSLLPDLILCSTALRARETVKAIIEPSGFQGDVLDSSDFYLAEPYTWIDSLGQVDDIYGRVMIVGHNPGLESLLQQLTSQFEEIPTATLACIELPIGSWQELSQQTNGTLAHLWRPKEL